MRESSLGKLVRFLDRLNENDFAGASVGRYLASNKLLDTDFAPYIFFREESYGRNLIVRRDNYELLVLTWLPEQRTPIHDHAGSRCWMALLSGSLAFKNYKNVRKNTDALQPVGAVRVHAKGESVYIDDNIGIHAIANASPKPAVSIHIYAKPITHCRIYNEETRVFEEVPLEYFTFPPELPPELLTV